MRNQLYTELVNLVAHEHSIEELKARIVILLDRYEITGRTTDVAIRDCDNDEWYIKKWLAAKMVKGCTERTIGYYKTTVSKILQEINKGVKNITTDDIMLYMAQRQIRDGVSQVTIGSEIRSLRSFYNYLYKDEMIKHNPMNKLEPIKKKKIKKEAFTEMDIAKLRSVLKTQKEKALFEILYSTWARVSEVANIKISEIDGAKILVHGKGEKDRYVYLGAQAQLAVERYLAERKDTNQYLFPASVKLADGNGLHQKCSRMGTWYTVPELVAAEGHIDVSTIEQDVRKWGKRAGVSKTHPHRFRRTGATFALRRGMPIEQVSKLLGHESIETTQIYLDIKETETQMAHEKYVI